jgi:putative aldouronate transport system substrate-binding protein
MADYINKDFAATSKTDQQKLFTSGTAGMYIGAMTDVSTLNKDLVKNVPTAVVDVHSMVAGPDGKFAAWALPGYANVVLFPKSANKTEADLRKVLAYFDKMMTPEVANMANWGIKDVNYSVTDNKAKKLDEEKWTREVKPFTDAAIGDEDTSGRFLGIPTIPAQGKADELKIANLKFAVQDPVAALDSKTNLEKGVQLQAVIVMQRTNTFTEHWIKLVLIKRLKIGKVVAAAKSSKNTTHLKSNSATQCLTSQGERAACTAAVFSF